MYFVCNITKWLVTLTGVDRNDEKSRKIKSSFPHEIWLRLMKFKFKYPNNFKYPKWPSVTFWLKLKERKLS